MRFPFPQRARGEKLVHAIDTIIIFEVYIRNLVSVQGLMIILFVIEE